MRSSSGRFLFVLGVAGLILFELAHVWFIMPLPGSQRVRSIDVAYFLYRWRWAFRVACLVLLAAGLPAAWRAWGRGRRGWRRALVPASLVLAAGAAYAANVAMAADHMFLQPSVVDMRPAARNHVEPNRLVVGVVLGGEARAYPVQFIGYHHQVRDTVAGRPVLVSYCTVCRTGRVFSPEVGGRVETFRLVGMDHFNAMLEDRTTGSWWRQANGEAIAGPLAGTTLQELPSQQMALATWLTLHPTSLIMQADPAARGQYAKGFGYENGTSRSALTGTDTVAWRDKAWVVGLVAGGAAKAYDWGRLRRERVIDDTLGGRPVVVALARDGASFAAFERPDGATRFAMRGDSLVGGGRAYALSGAGPTGSLRPLPASQEFWHSWRTFHPDTRAF